MKNIIVAIVGLSGVLLTPVQSIGQQSIARMWNEALLHAIRHDFARPTVHARNLFHTSMAMYDAWAAYDTVAENFFLGKSLRNFNCPFDGIEQPLDVKAARNEAISYAAYRVLKYRFRNSPNAVETLHVFDDLMLSLGYDTSFVLTDYSDGNPAALGNYIAYQVISFGLQDGSNEGNGYANQYYQPLNDPLIPIVPGNPDMSYPNRWQPLTLDVFIDQSGNVIPISTPPFLGPEWGNVVPFAMTEEDLTVYERQSNEYWVYHDPGPPAKIDLKSGDGWEDDYKWNHSLVSIWSAHLDPADGVMIDISPASFGNNDFEDYPTTIPGLRDFYKTFEGGDIGTGHDLNPKTGEPYEPQIVPRGDYTRVLAEFWADGPASETPPGHWFTILNYVNDHPAFEKRFMGEGPVLDNLEWDVKAYFILGGGVHDAAVTAWGIKGWYDYVRPISAIRWMGDQGQSTYDSLPNYDKGGLPIVPGYIEIVEEGDELAGEENEHVGKIKLYAWRGPDYIDDPETDVAGVGWILAENWWPYQRPTFVTPPFAGYISGHSTFSRTAAEILTLLTGDPFFPGGMGEFHAPMNEFLVFEEGPSVDMTLQWATYRDASDQTSLSRIWGGIHPPVDDIPGRLIGAVLGVDAFEYALCFFKGPDYQYDTVRLQCSPAVLDVVLDAEGVDRWEWIASQSGNLSGATGGNGDNGVLVRDTLTADEGTTGTAVYTVRGYLNQCESVVREVVVVLEDVADPVADFDVAVEDSSIVVFNMSQNATSYFWDFGDGSTDTVASPTHVYNSIGEYDVTLIVSNACGTDTIGLTVQISSASADDISVSRYFYVSPNPNKGVFDIRSDLLQGEFSLQVFDVAGRAVYDRNVNINGILNVDLSDRPSGVYFAMLSNAEVRDVVKVVVQ